jgi:hypothetical protein
MQMRQLRLPKKSRNMVKFPVRVIYKTEKEFYGVLRITADTIEVILGNLVVYVAQTVHRFAHRAKCVQRCQTYLFVSNKRKFTIKIT